MLRRDFLGSIIGFIGASAFEARLFHEPIQEFPQFYTNPKYRMLFRDTITGFTIQAPGVISVQPRPGIWLFQALDLKVTRSFQIDQVVVLTNKGIVLARGSFKNNAVIPIISGDTLIIDHTITCDVPLLGDFEVIHNQFKDKVKWMH